jgi:hypothetical protein
MDSDYKINYIVLLRLQSTKYQKRTNFVKKKRGKTIRKLLHCCVFFWIIITLTITGCTSTNGKGGVGKYGLEYELQTTETPRINRIHVLKLDLSRDKIKLAPVIPADPDGEGPADSTLTNPFKLAAEQSVIAFVNTNPWRGMVDPNTKEEDKNWREGQFVDVIGLAVSDGNNRSHTEENSVAVWMDAQGMVHIGNESADALAVEGTAGFKQILTDGVIGSGLDERLAPRTSIGLSKDAKTMWIVVVDGRQEKYSEGVNCTELATTMRDLGCWNAVNMDGGGSSIMALRDKDGKLAVTNSPSDRNGTEVKIRPVPIILTIREK